MGTGEASERIRRKRWRSQKSDPAQLVLFCPFIFLALFCFSFPSLFFYFLLFSVLFYSILFYSVLFCSVMFLVEADDGGREEDCALRGRRCARHGYLRRL
jgi:hypothetical protein